MTRHAPSKSARAPVLSAPSEIARWRLEQSRTSDIDEFAFHLKMPELFLARYSGFSRGTQCVIHFRTKAVSSEQRWRLFIQRHAARQDVEQRRALFRSGRGCRASG